MITLNFLELDDQTMVSSYSIKFDSGASLETMLNDIQKLERDEKSNGIGTIQIYKSKELYDKPIIEIKCVGDIIYDTEWKKIPICILNKPVVSAYMYTSILNGNYHIAITAK